MPPVSLIAYVDYMVELAQRGRFESYFCQDCLAKNNFATEYLPTDERQTDTAFCERCHVCKPVSNPYINQYVHSLITPLSDDPGTAWYSSETELVYYNLQGRGYRNEAWLIARDMGLSYEVAFQQNLKRHLIPYWRRPNMGEARFAPESLERLNGEADFIESSFKRIYGPDLSPLGPAPDDLYDHPVSEVVTDFAHFLIELAKTGRWEDLYCEACQLEHLHIEPRYLPFGDLDSTYAYLENTGFCSRCFKCNDVSNPDVNRYIIDRYPAFMYPRRQECNSDTYLIRDMLVSGQLRTRCNQTANRSAMPTHEGMTADQIYRYEYHKAMVESLNCGPGPLTPPHARLVSDTYLSILGPELMPLSERLMFPGEKQGCASSPRSAEILTGREASESGNTLGNRLVKKYFGLRDRVLKSDLIRSLKE